MNYRDLPGVSGTRVVAAASGSYATFVHRPETTEAMRIGSAAHAMVLEPDRLDELIAPEFDPGDAPSNAEGYRTALKAAGETAPLSKLSSPELLALCARHGIATAHALKSEHGRAHAGKLLLNASEAETARNIAAAVMAQPVASDLVRRARREVQLTWDCQWTGELCKGQIDLLVDGFVGDLKTGCNDGPEDVRRKMVWGNGALQICHYIAGALANGHNVSEERAFIIPASSRAPFQAGVTWITITPRTWAKYRATMGRIREWSNVACFDENAPLRAGFGVSSMEV